MSSNTTLYERIQDIIDFDAGPVITGKSEIPELGKELLHYLIEVDSGKKQTRSMRMGQNDFIPWKRGISL